MRIDSIVRRRGRGFFVACFCAMLASGTGCVSAPPTVVVDDLLEPVTPPTRWMPTAADLAAARLARAALVGQPWLEHVQPAATAFESRYRRPPSPETLKGRLRRPVEETPDRRIEAAPAVEAALERLVALHPEKEQEKLVPLALDLRNASVDDPIAYRERSRELRERGDLDPRLEGRLDRTIGDDPIHLAKKRSFDGWHRLWARTFNTVAEPLGSSAITGFVLAPYQLANSVVHYFADFSNGEPLSLTDRQALTLRKDFLRAHPDTELTPVLEQKIEASTIKLEKTLSLRRVRAGEAAFEAGDARLALHQADVAIERLSPHPEENGRLRKRAKRIQAKAREAVAERTRLRRLSLESRPGDPALQPLETQIARRLLHMRPGENDVAFLIEDYRELAGRAGEGRVEYVQAMIQNEDGHDFAARKRLARVEAIGDQRDRMARHARELLDDAWQNPYGAFVRLRKEANRDEAGWRLAGEWVRRTRYPNLPTPIAYLVDAPTIAITIILAPLRLLISPWTGAPDFRRAPALAAYRYLDRYPDGAAQGEIVAWLYEYESDMERWDRALRLADMIPNFDSEERLELVEKTAESRLARIETIDRRDNRSSMLKGVAREFPDSKGGREAGLQVRADLEDASAQHIRITKSFLLENPDVAGRTGIGLNPKLLNDDDADGELHPEGVVLRGGRLLEIRLVADGGDKKDPPESKQRKVSKVRLSRISAALDDAAQRNGLVDVDARQAPDAGRDVYLERAALELTDEPDIRPTAESRFVYQSLRERYGLVRGRDSVLPFDLVLRGSLNDMALGAFPRWRPPKETPDAFLYR